MTVHRKSQPARACIIVGVGSGIGESLALVFAREGYDIGLIARNSGKLAELCAEIGKLGRVARAYSADAGDDRALRQVIRKAERELGAVDVIIYNAARSRTCRPLALDPAQLEEEFRINLVGALTAAQSVATGMTERGRGSILFTGGSFAYEPAADFASLSMGKAALRNLTYALAQELGAHGVHVGTVTVYGFVQRGTRFDPHRIAESFLRLHRQPQGHFDTELIYK